MSAGRPNNLSDDDLAPLLQATASRSTTPWPAPPRSTTSNSKPPETRRGRARRISLAPMGYLLLSPSLRFDIGRSCAIPVVWVRPED